MEQLSFEEVARLVDIGIIDHPDLIKIYDYVKNGSSGELDLAHSMLTHLPNWLTKVDGILDIAHTNISDIPDTLIIKGSIYANRSSLKVFRKTEVFGSLLLDYTKISKLPDGLIVHGYFSVEGIQFEQFPKDLIIHGSLYISNSNLEQFSNTELRKMYKIDRLIYR